MRKKIEEIFFLGQDSTSRKDFEARDTGIIHVLKLFSPGTAMRTSLDDMLRAKMGALIVIDKEGIFNIVDGGFRVNCKFSTQRLVELAKMDGAIILSKDMKKILYSNALLVPSMNIKTRETGTRHKAAERTAKQINSIVIAVSERKNKVTIYCGEEKHILEKSSEILRRATETLQILEKQKESYDDELSHLNVLEVTNLTTTNDVCNILQRIEVIRRASEMVRRYLIELGKEGIIVSMRLKELTKNLSKEREMLLKDYFRDNHIHADDILSNMDLDSLLETATISKILFEELSDKPISPIGLRILNKTNLQSEIINLIKDNFGLEKIFATPEEGLINIFKDKEKVKFISQELSSLREKILAGKKI
ncbi:MAG TPA: DNA integrity scanning diadenylate cyclase DisA [Candidatus Nanoarchaeia archaeon]|nr:DNA integrity scanning diadenylate cyclase DisA [Candidatus Nanoarchaeia archaeon]